MNKNLKKILEDKTGTYAGVRFSSKTKEDIKKYINENKIPNATNIDKLHSTLLYSRKYLPDYSPAGKLNPIWKGKFKHFSIFKSSPSEENQTTNCLVLEYECDEQSKRFNYLMNKHKATYDFDDYRPHITLSYDVGDFDIKKLPEYTETIEIVEEYSEDLDLDWSSNK